MFTSNNLLTNLIWSFTPEPTPIKNRSNAWCVGNALNDGTQGELRRYQSTATIRNTFANSLTTYCVEKSQGGMLGLVITVTNEVPYICGQCKDMIVIKYTPVFLPIYIRVRRVTVYRLILTTDWRSPPTHPEIYFLYIF